MNNLIISKISGPVCKFIFVLEAAQNTDNLKTKLYGINFQNPLFNDNELLVGRIRNRNVINIFADTTNEIYYTDADVVMNSISTTLMLAGGSSKVNSIYLSPRLSEDRCLTYKQEIKKQTEYR